MLWKVRLLAEQASFDITDPSQSISLVPSPQLIPKNADTESSALYAITSVCAGGRKIPILKIMQSNNCKLNCKYCGTRRDADIQKATIQPEELARIYDSMYQARLVEGLFLTSAVYRDADYSMELMIRTVELLRRQYSYRGYIHLKMMPSVSGVS